MDLVRLELLGSPAVVALVGWIDGIAILPMLKPVEGEFRFDTEVIPDNSLVFRAVLHPDDFAEDGLNPKRAFRDIDKKGKAAMSVDWDKYCPNAEHALARRKPRTDDKKWRVYSALAGKVRRPGPGIKLLVVHDPIQPSNELPKGNRAHSLVENTSGKKKDYDARAALLHLFQECLA